MPEWVCSTPEWQPAAEKAAQMSSFLSASGGKERAEVCIAHSCDLQKVCSEWRPGCVNTHQVESMIYTTEVSVESARPKTERKGFLHNPAVSDVVQ